MGLQRIIEKQAKVIFAISLTYLSIISGYRYLDTSRRYEKASSFVLRDRVAGIN